MITFETKLNQALSILDMGDLAIEDSGDLGFDIYHKDGRKICFINKPGEVELMKWLERKNSITENGKTLSENPAFASRFDRAFRQLDQARGSHNFVSLVDLRKAIPVDRRTFDAELRALRIANRYTLSGIEGRFGSTQEERDAAIREESDLLLYVSRRT